MSDTPLRIGTRNSPLARWQAEWVAAQLGKLGVAVELVPISTRGDRQQVGPIAAIGGGEGVFTKELQRSLLAGEIDLAVHSLKDLPTASVDGLALLAVPERGPIGDVVICRAAASFATLPQGATIGTGSLRRRTHLWHVRPDLKMVDIRGNVDTRLRKLREGEYDALVLAEAGLHRLELSEHVTEVLPRSLILPAVGQGALGIEGRANDPRTQQAVAPLDHAATHAAVVAERTMLLTVRGGCLAPVGAWGRVDDQGQLTLSAVVLSGDGQTKVSAEASATPAEAAALGAQVAQSLIAQGAQELIQACRA
ncbi:MAG: hydroxymethylbilane synthase [Planctomycetaceae bacterium]|nr:hydroxymethylbilane synthase [Planctomycetaceae bacterium]